MFSVRVEVGVSLLLAPGGADKRGPLLAPFPLVGYAGIQPAIRKSTSGSSGRSRVLLKALMVN